MEVSRRSAADSKSQVTHCAEDEKMRTKMATVQLMRPRMMFIDERSTETRCSHRRGVRDGNATGGKSEKAVQVES